MSEEKDGICILSLDNGGPGTYSQLLFLKEQTSRLASDLKMPEHDIYPADYFDLMGGVGFGGLVAVMLGLLRMNITEAIEAYLSITSAVFSEVSFENVDRDINTKRLRGAIESMLQSRNILLDAKMNEGPFDQRKCKVVLYAGDSARIDHPQAFRTYSSRGASLNPLVIDAVCATMSLPSYFQPVMIGPPRRQQSFVGGVLGANNPTQLLLKEAYNIYGQDRRVASIISIGCGMARARPQAANLRDEPDVGKLLKEMVGGCEVIANQLSTWLWNVDGYLRLNASMDMETMKTRDWNSLGGIESQTSFHLARSEISEALGTALGHLRERIGTATLGQLNFSSGIKTTAKTPPAVSPHFILRKQPWAKMVDYLVTTPPSQQKIFPITGMGGCGKTQLVSYFLRQYPNLYAQTIYVDASSSSSIKFDLQAWARTLGDGHDDDVWEDAIQALSKIPGGEQWILILDNADDPGLDLNQFLPRHNHLTLLITSRNRDIGDHGPRSHLELGEMTPEEALAALLQAAQRKLPMDDEELRSAQTLIGDLGWLAIALVQAGSYCLSVPVPVAPCGSPEESRTVLIGRLSMGSVHNA
ncbi:hypothetical protein M408DRAFT_22187 [Serendipita vermifera MAFF 305830]|uniref:PNPLA domain-containing protein n=1 Tax=Serendipita vermifera MAFF 305830 TaxID=933852 RepID=A0A0C3BFD1_SERVB|nr:hypothetical protein M408DRAFT_22187 [Serendipita vermifera MAFF 305830]